MKKPCHNTTDIFGGSLLPDVCLPTIGYLTKACGEWHRFCRGWVGFNAVLPATWDAAYLETT